MEKKFTNELINETSPYLLQHAHNPVNWCAWNENSLTRAQRENKLLIISIGYSACHWCHVMEHESFEDETVAHIMNEHFVSLKVDREERPDIDQIYMDACQLITGRGGWPLNAIALPNGKPVYAGTYFPKENWKQLLAYFVDYWKNKTEEARQRAEEITNGIKQMDMQSAIINNQSSIINAELRNEIFNKFNTIWDYELGGMRGAPKFPMPVNLRYLMRNYFYTKNPKTLQAVTVTLNGMHNGGIYDHVGGGFARYSVDDRWEIPHFEKMLYDNAQLVSVYSEGYQLTKDENYQEAVYETLEFIEREMSDESGGFYSALDADSEGEEGKFYVWHFSELKKIIGDDFEVFKTVFDINETGNFEGANHFVRHTLSDIRHPKLSAWKNKLLTERSKRIRPSLDGKILTAWNALMLKGIIAAYKSFGEEKFLQRALRSANFIKTKMLLNDGSLLRNYKNGETTISGFLDDYAFTCEAFIALYQITFEEEWLTFAKNIAGYVMQHFYNVQTGIFFYTSVNDRPLIARKCETSDHVIPASNSAMFNALYQLGILFDNNDYIEKAKRAVQGFRENILQHPAYYSNWAMLLDNFIDEPFTIAVVGKNAAALRLEFEKYFLPNCIFTGTATAHTALPLLQQKFVAGETLIYLCKNKTCGLPVKTIAECMEQLA